MTTGTATFCVKKGDRDRRIYSLSARAHNSARLMSFKCVLPEPHLVTLVQPTMELMTAALHGLGAERGPPCGTGYEHLGASTP